MGTSWRRVLATIAAAVIVAASQSALVVTPAWGIIDPPLSDTNGVTGGYTQTNLVTDNQAVLPGLGLAPAAHTDTNLVNPWGMSSSSSGPTWVADNGTGVATLYDGSGNQQALVVTVPASSNAGATSPAPVTGVVFNPSSTEFNVSGVGTSAHFLFATEDGTIAGWNSTTSAVIKIDNADFSTTGSVYKGLALGANAGADFLYATNFRKGRIDVFDSTFAPKTLGTGTFTGTFTDPSLPAGYAPFGIANIGGDLFVTYAVQDASKHDDVPGAGKGIVDRFTTAGVFVQRVASNGGTLNSPWGIVRAPVGFGRFANDLLVGNFGDGRINAFDPSTFASLGQLTDVHDVPLSIGGLWALRFGNGGTGGSPGSLYFTAGINNEADGLFGEIAPAPTGPDLPATEGAPQSGTMASFTDGDVNGTSSQFSATIDWGDGSVSPADGHTVQIVADPVRAGVFDVNGTHTFAEEGSRTVTTKVTDTGGAKLLATVRAVISDGPLVAGGDFVTTGFTGIGGTNTSVTNGSANSALSAFEAAIGGANNGDSPPERTSGFRTVNWDPVALDGTDFGGQSTVIDANHVVNIPTDRWQERGVALGGNGAVSGPLSVTDPSTFADVNPSVDNLFRSFSPTKTFAPFNRNSMTVTFVRPATHGTAFVQQAVRGFGAIFMNVRLPNTTSIEYFNGQTSLGRSFVPVGAAGQAEFLGELFSRPIVTKVVLTLGTDAIFNWDGTSFSAGNADGPDRGVNLVAADDLVYAEPAALATTPQLHTRSHRKFNGIVGRFADGDPNGAVSDYTASIDWGDGIRTPAAIVIDAGGGFDITGAHRYRRAGRKVGVAHVADVGGATIDVPFVMHVGP